jgi:hypothetical protein
MNQQQINLFFDELKICWNKQNEETIKAGKHVMEAMLKSEDLKKHLANESDNLAKGIELYRDSEFGFILLAYSETKGLYRMPHNHGNGWVIYSVVEGIIEMGTYALIGDINLIKKEKHQIQIGNSEVYFPGDIHDTQCVSDSVIILRLTSCDLKEEEKQGRMKKFQKPCSLKT